MLVVDDDEDLAEFLRTVLERRGGCEVEVANDPRMVAAIIPRFQPDLLITDIEMPGMTGIELINAIRSGYPGLPVILMTAHATVDYAVNALRSEANEFMVKPVATGDLVSSVRRLAGEYRESQFDTRDRLRAADVQRSLQPAPMTNLENYQLAGDCVPSHTVGGDFFDWYRQDEHVIITLGDVMGKGVGAAIIAATVRSVMRGSTENTGLAAAITKADAELDLDLGRATSFVTMFHGSLEPATGTIRYVDAGHGLSAVVRADGKVNRLATTSLPLGLGLHETWQQETITLDPGDTFISASDGILDLFDGTLESLSEVEAIARAEPSAQAVVDALVVRAGSTAPDDVTVVVLRRLA